MNVFSTQIEDPRHVQPFLDGLWGRLQQVSSIAEQINVSQLDAEDKTELDAISRITCGYAHFLLETSASIDSDDPLPLDTIAEFAQLINAHCDDSSTALTHVLNLQSGLSRPGAMRVH